MGLPDIPCTIPPVFSRRLWSVTSNKIFLVSALAFTLSIFISYSETTSFSVTVSILAGPTYTSLFWATLYSLFSFISSVYIPNIPLWVFSLTEPYIVLESFLAFFSPGLPSVDLIIPVTSE